MVLYNFGYGDGGEKRVDRLVWKSFGLVIDFFSAAPVASQAFAIDIIV
jgi:hypothetical protein